MLKPSLLLRSLSSSAPRSAFATPINLQKHVDTPATEKKQRAVPAESVPVVWSPTLATSTRTTKSIQQLNHLAGEDLTWPEIAESMGAFVHDCKSQWIQLLNELEPLQPDVTHGFDHNALKTAVMYPDTFERFWLKTPQKTALVQANDLDWDKIASELFEGKFSPAFIRHQYINIARPFRAAHWRPQRIQRLMDYMASLGYTLGNNAQQLKEEPDWRHISDYICGSTFVPMECRNFWHKCLKKQAAGREWTQDQVIQYWKTWLKVGKNWRQIASSLSDTDTGSRDVAPPTATECREAYQEISLRIARERPDLYEEASVPELATEVVSRNPKDRAWTDELYQELMRVVKEEQEALHKRDPGAPKPTVTLWETVAKRLDQPGLTPIRCQNRYMRPPATGVTRGSRQLKVMKEDMKPLLDAVNERRPVWPKHWQQLRDDFFPNHSVFALKRMWKDHAMQDLSQSHVLMNQLEKAVLDHSEHAWKEIAEEMSKDGAAFKTMLVCREVWETQVADKSDPSWTKQETKELQEQVKQMTENKRRAKAREILEAPDWIQIGRMFPTKTSVQCREKWIELGFLRQQERVREKIRKIDPTFTFSPPIDVEKVAEEFWTDGKIIFNGDSDTTTTTPAATMKHAGTTKTASAQKSGPLVLTPDELDKAWKQYRWTPERIMVLKRVIDKYGRHPAVLAQLAEKLGARPLGCATTYERVVRSLRQDRLKWSSLETTKPRFLWSKEYDQFLACRMALVGVKYRSQLDAFNDVASVFDIKTLS
ncbi:hypothetical protein BG005_002093, partial [Podila minutissima]